jgi:hypothetical protein
MALRRELTRLKSGGRGSAYFPPPSAHAPPHDDGGRGGANGSGGERYWPGGDGPGGGGGVLAGLDVSGQADLNASVASASPQGGQPHARRAAAPPTTAPNAAAHAPWDRRNSLSESWGATAASWHEPRTLPLRPSVGVTPPRVGRVRAPTGGAAGGGNAGGGNGAPAEARREPAGKAAALAGAHAAALEAYLKTHP